MKSTILKFGLAALLLGGSMAFAQNSEGIRVNGNGVVWGAPDMAEFTVGVSTVDVDVAVATEQANGTADAIITALIEAGVAENDVKTSNFSVYTEDNRNEQGELVETLFRVSNTVVVTVRDTDQVGDLLALALDNGANQVNSLQFMLADSDELRAQARELAVQDAHDRAQQLAGLTGVSLGAPISIEEYSSGGMPVAAGRNYSVMAEAASVPVQAGELSVEVSVSIVYAIGAEAAE